MSLSIVTLPSNSLFFWLYFPFSIPLSIPPPPPFIHPNCPIFLLWTSASALSSLPFPSYRAGFLEFQMRHCVPHRPLSWALSFISGGLVHRVLRQPELSTGKGPRSGGGPPQLQLGSIALLLSLRVATMNIVI